MAKNPNDPPTARARWGLNQFENSTKSYYKDQSNGSSYRFDQTHKGREFITRRSGPLRLQGGDLVQVNCQGERLVDRLLRRVPGSGQVQAYHYLSYHQQQEGIEEQSHTNLSIGYAMQQALTKKAEPRMIVPAWFT
ncbi:hypothetical protein CRG98_000024 [Punica granatum]|uniref:Uncharacterized protein n=1 Tax=Punica granatum TaxID=22663 RepID=A0A2I0LFV1_PUNGR|nr:hypothetical protein CRG98_000024 [Punica granatum]